jgi:OOP family OmpA-OmpF porin
LILGSSSGGSGDDKFDTSLMALYANLSYYIVQHESFAVYLSGGVGSLSFDGELENTDSDFSQKLFSNNSMMLSRAIGFMYPVTNSINVSASFNLYNPLNGDGLDNYQEEMAKNGFSAFQIGFTYGFGKESEESAEWSNPIDVMTNKMNVVEDQVATLVIDTDGDGVADKFDKENNTPQGVAVDGSGRSLDVDSDGVPDYKDIDPFTAPGVAVDSKGLELDDDNDGVPNSQDLEPNSPEGCTVNFQGVQIVGKGAFLPTVYFDVSSSKLDYGNYQRLATVASVLKANPSYKLRVIGFADSVGDSEANYKLGLSRANAVIEILINTFSIDINRLIADSQGENNLLANEKVKLKLKDGLRSNSDGTRFLNRRVEFIIE